MESKGKSQKQKKIIVIFIISLILLIAGIILSYFSSAKYVAKRAVKVMSQNVIELANSRNQTGLEENFKTTSTIKVNLQSDYYQALSSLSTEYQVLSNLLRNLSNTETQITMIQDQQNKKMLINYDTKLSGQPLANVKYLVDNATEYYYIDGLTQSYVNNGNNRYFESLNSTTTTKENIEYIIEKITESAANNIKDEYLSESYEKEYKKITVTLTENDMVEFLNNILEELKKDSKANQILTGYDKDFSKAKVTKKDVAGLGTVTINIYIDKLIGQIKKYEVISDKDSITYYEGESKVIEIRNNDKLVTKLDITSKEDKTDIKITDENNKSIGSISISKTSTNYDIVANITTEEFSANFGYNSQITNLKEGKSYDSSTTISLDMTANNSVLFNGTMEITSTTTNDTTINEDVSNSVLASTVGTTPSELVMQKFAEMMMRLGS